MWLRAIIKMGSLIYEICCYTDSGPFVKTSCLVLDSYGCGKFPLRLIGCAMFGATFNLVTSVGVP